MIKVFYGEDRVKAQAAIRRFLGDKYEVVEGEELDVPAARDVFFGESLFGARKIVVKDLTVNEEVRAEIASFIKTEHEVALWESKLDKRKAIYKELKKLGVEMQEFKLKEEIDRKMAFDIFEVAFRDGERAVKMCEKIENTNDPYMFFGLMVFQAVKKWEFRYGAKEKRVLLELSKLDMQMKGNSVISSQWTLVKSFLLRVSLL